MIFKVPSNMNFYVSLWFLIFSCSFIILWSYSITPCHQPFFPFCFSDFHAHNTVPNAKPNTNDISPFLSYLLINTITCVLSSLFHDGLVSLGRVSGIFCKFLLENPSRLYQWEEMFPWTSWFLQRNETGFPYSKHTLTSIRLLSLILFDLLAHS